jgi:hypothetical protein
MSDTLLQLTKNTFPPKADLADYFFEHENLRWDREWGK